MAPYMLPTHGIIACRNSTKMVIRSRPGVNTASPLQKFQNLLVTYGDPAGLRWIQKDKSLLQILAINALLCLIRMAITSQRLAREALTRVNSMSQLVLPLPPAEPYMLLTPGINAFKLSFRIVREIPTSPPFNGM